MAKAAENFAADTAPPAPGYAEARGLPQLGAMPVSNLVGAAIARLREDMETYHPNRPFIAYALAGESHAAVMQEWSRYPAKVQIALLLSLREDATGLMHQLHERSTWLTTVNGYKNGLQDEAQKLKAQADIVFEEIHRIEAKLRAFATAQTLQ